MVHGTPVLNYKDDELEELPGSNGSDEMQLQSSGLGFCREKREDSGGPSHKRLKLMDSVNEQTPPPLGLTLKKTPSFINLVELTLSKAMKNKSAQTKSLKSEKLKVRNDDFAAQSTSEKLKASNLSALFLKIGSWERICEYDGDLVAKCYYAKRKLVWEVLESGLKSKIEIQWSDISAMTAAFRVNEPGILEIELSHPPLFFHETNPQPRKHTLWQTASDFTGGQASTYRRHFIQFPEGTLEKHYEKLLQYDKHLYMLSLKPFPTLNSPYFHSSLGGFPDYCYNLNMKTPRSATEFNFTLNDSSVPQFPYIGATRSQLAANQKTPNFELLRPTISVNSPRSVNDFPLDENKGVRGQVRDQRNLFWYENGSRGIGNRSRIQYQESAPIPSASQITSPFPQYFTSNSFSLNMPQVPSACEMNSFFPQHLMPSSSALNSNWPRWISSNNSSLNAIAEELLDEPSALVYADEQKILEKVNSMHSLLEPAQMNLTPESCGVKHREFGLGKNTNDLTISNCSELTYADEQKIFEKVNSMHSLYAPVQKNLESVGVKHREFGLGKNTNDLTKSNSSELTYEDAGHLCPISECEVIPLHSLPSYPHLSLDQEVQVSVNDSNIEWNQWRN